jgi:hypothetical protein
MAWRGMARQGFFLIWFFERFSMALETVEYKIRGIAPLIMHNGQTADPLNKFSRQLKEISGKRKKTEEDYAEMARIEWHAGLYVNADGFAILPASILESAIQEGARKQKLGKQFKSSVFVDDDAVLEIGAKKKAVDLWGDDNYRDTRGVKVGMARIMRTRPIFAKWSTSVVITFDNEQVNLQDVHRSVIDTGSKVGLCDYRPKFGRFEVVE